MTAYPVERYQMLLYRNGKQWPLPYEVVISHDAPIRCVVGDTLHPGDEVDLAPMWFPAAIDIRVWPPNARENSPDWFHRKTSPFRISIRFMGWVRCDLCGTEAGHHLTIPEYDTWVDDWEWVDFPQRRYVLRTCIICDHAWEQEGT